MTYDSQHGWALDQKGGPPVLPTPTAAQALGGNAPIPIPAGSANPRVSTSAEKPPVLSLGNAAHCAPPWIVSAIVHMLLMIVLGLVFLSTETDVLQLVSLSTEDAQVEDFPPEQVLKLEQIKALDDVRFMAPVKLPQAADSLSAPHMELSTGDLAPSSDQLLGLGGAGLFVDRPIGGAFGLAKDFSYRVEREGGKSGDIQISLLWNNYNDLDLHVRCPSGENIFFGSRKSKCGGELDVDMNVPPGQSREPVENVVWPKGKAARGEFQVGVHLFRDHGDGDPSKFYVRALVDGKQRYFNGAVSRQQPWKPVWKFVRK